MRAANEFSSAPDVRSRTVLEQNPTLAGLDVVLEGFMRKRNCGFRTQPGAGILELNLDPVASISATF